MYSKSYTRISSRSIICYDQYVYNKQNNVLFCPIIFNTETIICINIILVA